MIKKRQMYAFYQHASVLLHGEYHVTFMEKYVRLFPYLR